MGLGSFPQTGETIKSGGKPSWDQRRSHSTSPLIVAEGNFHAIGRPSTGSGAGRIWKAEVRWRNSFHGWKAEAVRTSYQSLTPKARALPPAENVILRTAPAWHVGTFPPGSE